MADQRLPIVNSDDGTWGDILRQYLLKEHYDGDGNVTPGVSTNGGHKTITIRAGTASAGTAPLKFTSGTLLTTPEAGAVEFLNDTLYFTQTTGPTRTQILTSTGTQTLTNKTLTSPKIDTIVDANGNNLITFTTTASAANYLDIKNNAAGFSPTISAVGSSSNIHINLIPKGVSGRITENGVEVATVSRVQTLSNKTLASPGVTGDVTQSGDRPFLLSNHTAGAGFAGGIKWQQSGTNKLELFYDTSSHSLNYWNADGTDTGARMIYNREGYMYIGSGGGVDTASRLRIYDNRTTATSGDVRGLMSEILLDPSGSASTRAWGVQFIAGTKSGNAQNLTGGDAIQGFEGKAQHNGTGTVTGANGGLLYIENTSTGTITNARTLNLFPMANANGGTVTSAYHIVTNGLPVFSANNQTRVAIDIAASTPDPGAFTGATAAAIRLSGGNGVRDGILFSNDVTLYRSAADTLKTDDNFIVGTPGTVSGSVATIDGTQTLTNKSLTSPIIGNPQIPTSIYDSNWNQVIDLVGIGSAVNHYYVTNQSAGNYPTIGTDGSDSNIGIAFAPKGSGPVRVYVSAGQTPVIDVAGPDTNLNINLVPKGTGAVQQNGVNVATVSGSQTLTNKTINLSSNTISGTTAQFNTALSDGNFAVFDGNNNFSADTFIKGATWTTASGGTTVLSINSTQVQAFSGSANHTVRLPTTSVVSGQSYTIVNATNSGTITVQSSNGDIICTIPFNGAGVFTAGPDTPVDQGNWVGNVVGAGAVFSVTNTMTFSGNDGTFMTFPSSSDDIVGEVATQTLTNKTISGANNTLIALPYDLTAVAFGYVSPRTTGTGDFPFGIKLQRACTFTSVTYRCNTADASGNLVVELRKNGVAVSGTSASIAAASQISGGTVTGSWSFSVGDILTVYVTGVGTTPGNGLIADIMGVTA